MTTTVTTARAGFLDSRDERFAQQTVAHHLAGHARLIEIAVDRRIDPRVRAEADRYGRAVAPATVTLIDWLRARGCEDFSGDVGALYNLASLADMSGPARSVALLDIWEQRVLAGITRCLDLLLMVRTSSVAAVARSLLRIQEEGLRRLGGLRGTLAA